MKSCFFRTVLTKTNIASLSVIFVPEACVFNAAKKQQSCNKPAVQRVA